MARLFINYGINYSVSIEYKSSHIHLSEAQLHRLILLQEMEVSIRNNKKTKKDNRKGWTKGNNAWHV